VSGIPEGWFAGDDAPKEVIDPLRAARTAMKPPLPKRFYKTVDFRLDPGVGFLLLLDGRPARTPARNALAVPSVEAVRLLMAEWEAQTTTIDPASMHATRTVNAALDQVVHAMEVVRADLMGYAGSDLLCYRTDTPAMLVERQARFWDPSLRWAADALGAHFVTGTGITFIKQPPEAIAAIGDELLKVASPIALASLHVMTTISGSLILPLAVAHGQRDPSGAFDAAEIDADTQMELWGSDEEALVRRARRHEEFVTVASLLRAVGAF
jgi:chaperone required for assembly of F1-ATPase